jgi:hypothetical protein
MRSTPRVWKRKDHLQVICCCEAIGLCISFVGAHLAYERIDSELISASSKGSGLLT